MMKERNNSTTKVIFILFLLFVNVILYAQGPSNPGSDPDVNPSVPVDGGISLLIAAGLGFGIKKIKNNKNVEK